MRDPTIAFIMRRFAKYYSAKKLQLPDRLSKREFGFMFFDRNFVMRHIGFRNREDLRAYILENVPAHIYYSSAYYKNPNAQNMTDKGWMGADLVFDLDADHVTGASDLSYPEMLLRVKHEVIRLLDEFILGDLGFDEKNIRVIFSGGRGYHVHVMDQRVLGLGSQERREIVDYITGTDLDFEWVFPSRSFDLIRFGQTARTKSKMEMPDNRSGGWKRRLATGLEDFVRSLDRIGEDEMISRYSSVKDASGRAIGVKTLRGMYSELFVRRGDERGADRLLREKNLEIFSRQNYLSAFMKIFDEHARISLAGETDEPVTSDVKRLIRLPSSLHGKTGLKVSKLSRSELDEFDPLRDAFPSFLSDASVRVEISEAQDITLRGERFVLEKGETEVPEFAALFLACRRMASIIQS